MSLEGLFTGTFGLYRKTTGEDFPPTDTWALQATIPCYVSYTTITVVNSDGTHIPIKVVRFRTEPYSYVTGDRIYYDSHIYGTDGKGLGYEDFDGLGSEAVTIGQLMDDSVISQMGIT
jgi:hypothetical protein